MRTKEGIDALAEFVKKSKALQKQKTQTNREEILAARLRDQSTRGAKEQSDAPTMLAYRFELPHREESLITKPKPYCP